MLLRLSRSSFWLSAAVAAFALLGPSQRATLLMAISGAASLLALALWRSALHAQRRVPMTAWRPASPPVLDAAALKDACARLLRDADAAPTFERRLHAVAGVLRAELGARAVTVHAVHAVTLTDARISDLIEAQPGFRTRERRLPLDATPLACALREQRAAGRSPGTLAVPVTADGRVVGAIALEGVDLAIDAGALDQLLDLAQAALSAKVPPAGSPWNAGAPPCRAANVLVNEDKVGPPASPRELLRTRGRRLAATSGMLDGLQGAGRTQCDLVAVDVKGSKATGLHRLPGARSVAPAVPASGAPGIAPTPTGSLDHERHGAEPRADERLGELGFDDHLCKPIRRSQMVAMLNKQPRLQAPQDASAAGAVPGGPPPVLDPAALARLGELDPKGESRLLERVLRAFQSSAARLGPQLDTARAGADRPTIRLVAHTLKSSSASIGALHLSQLCAEVEAAIRLDTGESLEPRLDALGQALDAALQGIAALLKERA